MRSFQVYLNGERMLTAGVTGDGELSASILWLAIPGDCGGELKIRAFDSTTDVLLGWSGPKIRIGDDIRVAMVEAEPTDIDPPTTTTKRRRFEPSGWAPQSPKDISPGEPKDHAEQVLERCSFCNNPAEASKPLIAGANQVFICSECVESCQKTFIGTGSPLPTSSRRLKVPTDPGAERR